MIFPAICEMGMRTCELIITGYVIDLSEKNVHTHVCTMYVRMYVCMHVCMLYICMFLAWGQARYCSDATSHSRGQYKCVQVQIYSSDQAKSFKSREFTQELTQLCKYLFLFK